MRLTNRTPARGTSLQCRRGPRTRRRPLHPRCCRFHSRCSSRAQCSNHFRWSTHSRQNQPRSNHSRSNPWNRHRLHSPLRRRLRCHLTRSPCRWFPRWTHWSLGVRCHQLSRRPRCRKPPERRDRSPPREPARACSVSSVPLQSPGRATRAAPPGRMAGSLARLCYEEGLADAMINRAGALLPILVVLTGCCLEVVSGMDLNDAGVGTSSSGSSTDATTGGPAPTTGGTSAGSSTGGSSSGGSSTGGTTGGTTGGACGAVVAGPPDAGPLVAFEPNPLRDSSDAGVTLTVISLAGEQVGGTYYLAQMESDGHLLDVATLTFDAGASGTSLEIVLPTDSSPQPESWSADDGGHVLTQQLIIDASGRQVCTAFGQPCGSFGDCCYGLSCQAVDAGCSCGYAWPAWLLD